MTFLNRMKGTLVLILNLYVLTPLTAQTPPPFPVEPAQTMPTASEEKKTLIIGVDPDSPPFVVQVGTKELSGFDINMMNKLCKIIQRHCEFKMMKWPDLLPAVLDNKIDMAVSGITITLERSKTTLFSLPYTLSYSRILTSAKNYPSKSFNFSDLNKKKIGVYSGTLYETQAKEIGIKDASIIPFVNSDDAIKALTNDDVDFLMLDNATGIYWAANSSGQLKLVGTPYVSGYGMGIALSPQDEKLLPEINKALIQYQNSQDYQENYKRFLNLH